MATISSLVSELESEINRLMIDFDTYGKAVNDALAMGSDLQIVFENYRKMADIVLQLKPVEDTIKDLYPQYTKIFDVLLLLSKASDEQSS